MQGKVFGVRRSAGAGPTRGAMSYPALCVHNTGVYSEVSSHPGTSGKTQVFVVYDGLLEQAPHEVQCAVLHAGQQLAKVVAPKATRSPAAAAQLEWLLQVGIGCMYTICLR